MKWIENHVGLWALIQASGTIFAFIALLISIYSLRDQLNLRAESDLDQLIKSRNVSWWMARYIPGAVDRYDAGAIAAADGQIMKACLRRVSELSLANIQPASLSEQFLDIEIIGEKVLGALKGENLGESSPGLKSRLNENFKVIDAQITRQGGKIVDNIATK